MFSTGELWSYAIAFSTLVAAGLGLPAPEELVVCGAGVLAGQLPHEPHTEIRSAAHPTPTEVAGLLAFNPSAGSVSGLPWGALARCVDPQLTPAGVVALLAVNPAAGAPAAVPWGALVNVWPPVEEVTVPADDDSVRVRWWIMLPVCILGVVLADIILYALGRRFGDRLLNYRWFARVLPRDRRKRTEENFHRYGVSILVFGRLMPGIRAPLFLTAGSMRLPLARFLLADGLGAVVGNSLFFFLGFWMGDSVKTLIHQAEDRFRPILIVVSVGLVVAFCLWHFLRHPVSTGDPNEVPIIGHQVASHIEHSEAADKNGPPPSKAAEKETPETRDSA